jgi:hypothetical protein
MNDKRFTAACCAMQGMLANPQLATANDSPGCDRCLPWDSGNQTVLARRSVELADALLSALGVEPDMEPTEPPTINEMWSAVCLKEANEKLTAEVTSLKAQLRTSSRDYGVVQAERDTLRERNAELEATVERLTNACERVSEAFFDLPNHCTHSYACLKCDAVQAARAALTEAAAEGAEAQS